MELKQSKFKNFSIFFLIPLILSIGLASSISFFDLIQEAEGVPAVGPNAGKSFGSKTKNLVCGDKLCSEIEETPEPKVTEEEVQERFAQRIGEVMVEIKADPVDAGEKMRIIVDFDDLAGNNLEHVNFNIKAEHNGKVILNKQKVYDANGHKGFITKPLVATPSIDGPVDIQVEFLGVGINETFSDSEGVVTTQVVPEFGTIAVMILGFAIISIIAVTARSKVIPRL